MDGVMMRFMCRLLIRAFFCEIIEPFVNGRYMNYHRFLIFLPVETACRGGRQLNTDLNIFSSGAFSSIYISLNRTIILARDGPYITRNMPLL